MNIYTNILNAVSNLFGIIPLCISIYYQSYYEALLIFNVILASIIYHLSETSHNLPGILLKKYSNYLLAIDRIFAIGFVSYLIYTMSINKYIDKIFIIIQMICSLILLIGSELVKSGLDPMIFTMLHSMWHGFAWIIAGEIIQYNHI